MYAICSLPCEPAPPKLPASWIRGHWHTQHKLHYMRDVRSDRGHLPLAGADRSTVRTGHGLRCWRRCGARLEACVIGLGTRTSLGPAGDRRPTLIATTAPWP